ncbi:lysoplasmalogenase family protein [Novosphingobium sp.]|uniref:lysoplasmalogenase family protein n=1 Tax=Novosphingobium sp. TaxID=1874826 RepID=UPI0025E401FB|nr:lysoplasmalogenase family protein [Novosphingobium sp.]MCC6925557.1 lysoplasmalogenase [Novosphingobium sp.]
MPQRALIEERPWLLASLVAGISFYFIRETQLPGLYQMAWKGAGVALLAVYALVRHSGADSRQIAAVMAFGALGDVLIEIQLEWGAVAFLIGHLVAIHLYLRHRRSKVKISQKAAALAFLVLIPAISFLLPADRAAAPGVALYATGLGAMTAAAWTSSFSRYTVGLGAVMFAISDLLIFARIGPLAQSAIPNLLIWPLYYFGQFLICTGVIGELRRRHG